MKPFRSLLLASVLLAACSGSDAASTTTPTTEAVVTTLAPVTTAGPVTTTEPTTSTIASPSGGVFPGADWESADLPASVDRAALDTAVDTAFGAPDATGRVRSIVVVQGGRITYERYHPLDSADTVMESYSVAKSVTSSLVGILVGDGKLDVKAPAPVAQWADPADPRHAITLENLLHMASGLQWTEAYGPGSPLQEMLKSPVAGDWVASQPLSSDPGTTFQYSTGTTALIADIATEAAGGVDEMDTFMEDRLFGPLGITTEQLQRDQTGHFLGGFGANMTTRDFARFGLLYLNDGVWNGTRILPEGWVEYSHTPSSTNPQYGAQWWMFRDGAFEARGLFGQVILVSQEKDLVIAINTTQGGDVDTLLGAIYPLFT